MNSFENEQIEFKARFTNELYKEVIAFANTDGGMIKVGVDDNGNVVGMDDIDETYNQITNGIRDAIMPDVTMFVKYTLEDNGVIKIMVSEGSAKPYYLKAKGLKPSGVYTRQGASCVPASYEQIRQMIKEADGDVFEEMRSIQQELTFHSAADAFDRYHVKFEEKKYRVLGITDLSKSLYTNLALLLSDQCQHTIKVAVFADMENTAFRDSREFSGSVLKQLDDTFTYLRLCNKTLATFKGLERIECPDYPEEAVREVLLNAIVHRDYSFSGSTIININDREMEFISIGGLLYGLSADDIRSGISQPRNKNLAELFHRLHLIEAYGTGIRKIYKLYHQCAAQPRIEVTANTFKMILPNMNYRDAGNPLSEAVPVLSEQKRRILAYVENNGTITEREIGEILDVRRTRAYTLAKQMCDEGLLDCVGRGDNKNYFIK